MVGFSCWLVVHTLLNINGSHMDDLCHPYHSWYTETGNSMRDLTLNNTKLHLNAKGMFKALTLQLYAFTFFRDCMSFALQQVIYL